MSTTGSSAEATAVMVWWGSLIFLAGLNIAAWVFVSKGFLSSRFGSRRDRAASRAWQVVLSGGYVLGCAFRSVLPRVDVQRICLYDSWLSSVFIGRSVATVAELAFVAQWALLLSEFGEETGMSQVVAISRVLVPMIAVAEVCSWYAVLTGNFLGHAFEESLWAVAGVLATLALVVLRPRFAAPARRILDVAIAFGVGYVLFMSWVDVPMYLTRWHADELAGKAYLSLRHGAEDALFRRVVTRRWQDWRPEMPWMTLYFSLAVWASIAFIRAPRCASSARGKV